MTDTNSGGMFSKLYDPNTAKPAVKSQKEVENKVDSPTDLELAVESGAPETPTFTVSKKQPAERTRPQPKAKEIRMTLPLPPGSMEFLDQMERELFLKRPINLRSKQRLTKNSILRAWVALLKEIKANINNVKDEQDLTDRLKTALYQLKK